MRLWDLRSGRCIRTLDGHEDTVSAVQFSPDGRWAFSASWDQTIRVWDLSSGRCWGLLEGYRDRLTSLRLSADGLWLLSGCADRTARLWALDWELEAPGTN
jgi:WD40 repeat protein